MEGKNDDEVGLTVKVGNDYHVSIGRSTLSTFAQRIQLLVPSISRYHSLFFPLFRCIIGVIESVC
jgi:hypothetical protein